MKLRRTEVKSEVSDVTVFQGRAQVTRTVKVKLAAGNHEIVFPEIPANIDPESLQVKGKGESTLGECVFATEYFTENIDEKTAPLQKHRQELEDKIAEITLEINACSREKELVEKIAQSAVMPPLPPAPQPNQPGQNQPQPANTDPKLWTGLIDFYHAKGCDIDVRRLNAEREIRGINTELQKIHNELAALGGSGSKSRNIVSLKLSKEKEGEVLISLTYTIHGPTWHPVYNVRAESDSDKILIEYDALVRQASGEDWNNVQLKLSTARVNVSGIIPVLYPWRLEFYRPMPAMNASRSMAKAKKAQKSSMPEGELAASCPEEMIEDELYEQPMQRTEAEVESGGTSVIFSVPGGSDIGSDNTDTRVSISKKDYPAEFLYSAVPKLSPFAYLTAKIKNNAEYPLLPGRANIFFNSSLVGTSAFDLVMPDQETDTSLGVDEGIKTEYRFIKRFRKNEGLVNKKINEQFEYQIRLTNNLKKTITINVYDQFPVSQDKEISVKMIAPVIKENQKNPSLDDEAKICWKLDIEKGKPRELPVSYIVEYPQGISVSGL